MKTRHFLLSYAVVVLTLRLAGGEAVSAESGTQRWIGTWATSPQLVAQRDLPPDGLLANRTLRQLIRVSAGGHQLRVRLSNEFGRTPLQIVSADVAKPASGGSIVQGSDRPLRFAGSGSVVIPAGAQMVSDPVPFELEPLSDLAITISCRSAPDGITGHPGSRTTSFIADGADGSHGDFGAATPIEHWYFIKGVDVPGDAADGAIAIIGDSITDGRGSTTNGNDRWADQLARRLHESRPPMRLGVLNEGIGGNRLLSEGLGCSALGRLDRDVLGQAGVRWMIVIEGVNDIGTAAQARKKGEPAPTANDVIAALEQIIYRAHAAGIRVFGGTILPFGGSFYNLPGAEEDRKTVNDWIRNSGRFDGVIDFDSAVRDSANPRQLAAAADSGDHLHLNPAGYRLMAHAVDLGLFWTKPAAGSSGAQKQPGE